MIFSKNKLSLTVVLAITFFMLVVVALFVSSTLLLISYSDTVRASIISKQEAVAQKAATTVSSFLSERINTIKSISKIENLAVIKKESLIAFTNNLLGSDPAYRQIFIMGKDGEDLARASRIPVFKAETMTNIYERELIEGTSENSVAYSEVYIDEESNEPMMLISMAVLNIYSELSRYLFVEINLKFMWEIMQNIQIGKTGYAYVVDAEGYLVAFRDSSRILVHENLSRILPVKNFIENPDVQDNKSISYKGLINEKVIGSYIPLKELQWAVIAEMPITEADEPVYNNVLNSLIITLIIALLSGGFGIFIANYLVHPLINLTNIATRISQGELELKAKVTGTKEVALLSSVFNTSNGVLTEIISKAKELTNNLNASTIQIQSATEEQTSASSQIASSVTEISATLEELSITAKQITSNVGDLVLSSQDTAKLLRKIEKQFRLSHNLKTTSIFY